MSDDDVKAGCVFFLYVFFDDFSVLLTVDYSRLGGHGSGAAIRKVCGTGTCFVGDPFTGIGNSLEQYILVGLLPQSRNTFDDSDFYGVAANLDWMTSFGTFTAIAGYRGVDVKYVTTATD